jgi:hypothetical protein
MGKRVPERIDPEIGLERQCQRCLDWWPKDEEFFFFQDGNVQGHCKACCAELRQERRVA